VEDKGGMRSQQDGAIYKLLVYIKFHNPEKTRKGEQATKRRNGSLPRE